LLVCTPPLLLCGVGGLSCGRDGDDDSSASLVETMMAILTPRQFSSYGVDLRALAITHSKAWHIYIDCVVPRNAFVCTNLGDFSERRSRPARCAVPRRPSSPANIPPTTSHLRRYPRLTHVRATCRAHGHWKRSSTTGRKGLSSRRRLGSSKIATILITGQRSPPHPRKGLVETPHHHDRKHRLSHFLGVVTDE
jgi:hypothetical protein